MTLADGRVRRGERNREAIIDALMACYHDGEPDPSVSEVATRAGVSVRSVHNHFADVEALRAEVAQRQWQRYAHLAAPPLTDAPLAERIRSVVGSRAELFEAVTPVRRAALLSVHESPTIAANLAEADRRLRRSAQRAFAPELGDAPPETLDALDAALSWDMWNRLRGAQGCSVTRTKNVVASSVAALFRQGDRP